jgi:hypothetical protein
MFTCIFILNILLNDIMWHKLLKKTSIILQGYIAFLCKMYDLLIFLIFFFFCMLFR